MTEAEWVAATDPQPMLEFLAGKASDRKLRLFACACCRQIWHLLTDKRSRKAVQVAERLAEGIAKSRERVAASAAAWRAAEEARLAGRGHADAATEAAEGAWTALRESSDEEDLATIAFNAAWRACARMLGDRLDSRPLVRRVPQGPARSAVIALALEQISHDRLVHVSASLSISAQPSTNLEADDAVSIVVDGIFQPVADFRHVGRQRRLDSVQGQLTQGSDGPANLV